MKSFSRIEKNYNPVLLLSSSTCSTAKDPLKNLANNDFARMDIVESRCSSSLRMMTHLIQWSLIIFALKKLRILQRHVALVTPGRDVAEFQ